jgi:diguanylate cyclase (GGDEF)-like protein
VVLTDAAGRTTAANGRAGALLPEAAGRLRVGADWGAAVAAALPAFADGAAAELSACLSGPTPALAEAARADGRWLRVSRSPARDGGAVAILSDVTGLKAKEAALAETNRRFGAALDNMAQGLALFGADDRLLVANRRALELLRLPPEAAAPGTGWRELTRAVVRAAGHPEAEATALAQDRFRFAARRTAGTRLRKTPDGQVIALSLTPTADGGFVAAWQDVTERERAQARIAHLARHDGLTGLPNRSLLGERLAAALEGGRPFALHCLDLDGFRGVNDAYGTPAGDRVLAAVAERLRRLAGPDDLPARLSGDEFAVLQTGAGPSEAEDFAARMAEALAEPHDLDGDALAVRAHAGFALGSADGAAADALLRHAGLAAERAKAEKAAAPRPFHPDMDAAQRARRTLEAELRRALAADALTLHYQPQVDAAAGRVTGLEALLRWRHPQRGWISPAEFIPVAEQSGLIVPLGEWALRRAARDAAGWPHRARVAVNVSPLQFRGPGLGDAVFGALRDAGLPAGRLEVEITESALLDDGDAVLSVLHRLRAGGVRVAMDDFGTGFSSLATLRSFPFDKIKIDQSFVRVPEAGVPQAEAIVRAVAGLAAALGMRCTAEGVETAAQLDRLAAAGCNEVQGYLFGRPCPAGDVPGLIAGIEAGFAVDA